MRGAWRVALGCLLGLVGLLSCSASCSDHSGPNACVTCAGAVGTLGHCAWCPIDDKCAQCLGIECKAVTKCDSAQMIKAANQCGNFSKNWTAPPSKLISSCEFERITCAHGTKMNNSYCQRAAMLNWPACPGAKCVQKDGNAPSDPASSPYPIYRESEDKMLAQCKCPFWLNGTDCSLVVAPAALPRQHKHFDVCAPNTGGVPAVDRHVWDGSFINMKLESEKHLECYLDQSKTPFTLDAHRVNVTIAPATSGKSTMRDVTIAITMRRIGSHPDAQTPTDLAAMKQCETSPLNVYEHLHRPAHAGGRAGPAVCMFPRQTDIACTSFDCTPSYVPSQTDDKLWDAHYDCESAKCTPWAGLEATAKALLLEISGQRGGLQFDFKNPNTTFGKAHTLFVTKAMTFDMRCMTGQCVPTNQSAPSLPKHLPRKPISLWTVAAFCVVGFAGLIGTWVASMMHSQRRPGDPSKCGGGTCSLAGRFDDRRRVTVAFADVAYIVPQPASDEGGASPSPGSRCVLQSASGMVAPGEMCAVMGPSGAGKSSLLDILGGHNKSGSVDGRTHLLFEDGGCVVDAEMRRAICRYVMQDDRILATETVEEALTFSACMSLPNSVGTEEILEAVDEVIELLALENVRLSRVGSSDAGGLSGGERRRLAVGLELITRPAVLLADEPTSGLDSVSADIVMRTLFAAASNGCSIIVTIHQPSASIFRLFTTVLLLGQGGRQAFFGPPANAVALARQRRAGEEHGERQQQQAIVAAAATGADASIDVVQIQPPEPEPEPEVQMVWRLNPAEELLRYLVDVGRLPMRCCPYQSWEASPGKAALGASISQVIGAAGQPQPPNPPGMLIQANGEASLLQPTAPLPAVGTSSSNGSRRRSKSDDLPGGYAQFALLSRRGLRQVLRDPSLMFLQLIVTVAVGALTGGLFYKLDLDLTGVHNRTGLLFFIVIYFSLISMSSIGAIVNDKDTFLRERAAGLYTTQPFFASKVLCDILPLRVLPPVLFGLIVYPMCGLHEGRMGVFVGAILLLNMTASAMYVPLCARLRLTPRPVEYCLVSTIPRIALHLDFAQVLLRGGGLSQCRHRQPLGEPLLHLQHVLRRAATHCPHGGGASLYAGLLLLSRLRDPHGEGGTAPHDTPHHTRNEHREHSPHYSL